MAIPFPRTLLCIALVIAGLAIAGSDIRVATWESLLPFFDWMETTWFGQAGKTWGAVFAVVQAGHLLGLALLGGAVLLGDGRLLGFWFTDVANADVQARAHRLFLVALGILIASGIFMACAVAIKIYYMPVFWYKMLALTCGVLFALCIRRPFVQRGLADGNRLATTLVAIASIMVWFTVAATGRWIGFS